MLIHLMQGGNPHAVLQIICHIICHHHHLVHVCLLKV